MSWLLCVALLMIICYLGQPRESAEQTTPKLGIVVQTNGYDQPLNWRRRRKKLLKRGVTEDVIDEIQRQWQPDESGVVPILDWVDEAWEQTRDLFCACPGRVGERARHIRPEYLRKVIITPTIWEPYPGVWTAGWYYPDRREVAVVCIYRSQTTGEIRHARTMLIFEIGNLFSLECGIRPEDPSGPSGRPAGWPCFS